MEFKGVITALITPFWNQKIDLESFKKLIFHQLDQGIEGFVINGTTGESPTLNQEEVSFLFENARKIVGTKIPLIVGVGSNSTETAKKNAKWAENLGADGILVVVPYYNKPPQRGIFEHFVQVAECTHLPLIMYNVPSRTVIGLELNTIIELSKHPRIVAIKEASGHIELGRQIIEHCKERLTLLSGDDETYEELAAIGAQGIISVASHLIPQAYLTKKIKPYKNLIQALYSETNPIPIKAALNLLEIIRSSECRLPLVSASKETQTRLKHELSKFGLLK